MSVSVIERSVRFGVSGILVTIVHVATEVTLIRFLQLSQVVANEIAFCVGTLISYSLNTAWSFSSRPSAGSLLRFLVVVSFGFLLTTLIASVAQRAGWSYWVGILAIIVVIPPITFLLHYFWTFRDQSLSPARWRLRPLLDSRGSDQDGDDTPATQMGPVRSLDLNQRDLRNGQAPKS